MKDQNPTPRINTTQRSRMLTGMFADRQSTESAYNVLHERGYTKDDINLVMSDQTRDKHFPKGETELGTKAFEGTGTGAAIGGVVGAAVGIIAAVGASVAIPGLGLVIAGPIIAGLAGAAGGGVTGGLIGTFVGSGMTDERARLYDSGVKEGKIVMGVNPRNDEDAEYFRTLWNSSKAEQVHY